MIHGPIWLMQPIPYFGEKIRGSWLYEPKIDGWRMQIIRYDDGRTECWGRRLERKPNWSGRLPSILRAAEKMIPHGTLLDCELYSTGGRRFIPSLFAQRPKVKPIVYVFDVIYAKNQAINRLPLRERKKILDTIHLQKPFFVVRGNTLTNLKKSYAEEVKKGHEGIVIKELDSPYLIGKEAPIATEHWRKIK